MTPIASVTQRRFTCHEADLKLQELFFEALQWARADYKKLV